MGRKTDETPRLRMLSTHISPFLSNPHLFCKVHEMIFIKFVENDFKIQKEENRKSHEAMKYS